MAQSVTTTVEFMKWPTEEGPFTTQEQLDECAEELWAGLDGAGAPRHIASGMLRGWDMSGDFRRLEIHSPEEGGPLITAQFGVMVILFNGKPEVLTPEQFTARGFSTP